MQKSRAIQDGFKIVSLTNKEEIMETRRFGRSGHLSTVAIFGAAAFWDVEQAQADKSMQLVVEHGVNHIDVAPSYGKAEERLGPLLQHVRDRFFIGCKTMERTREGAASEMAQSLKRLRIDAFDLYQIHAITSMAELDQVTAPGGALEAIQQARTDGLTRYIGITGHGVDSPAIFCEALERFDFDSVLFPLNYVQFANPVYRRNSETLLKLCQARDVGVMVIKSITRGPWGQQPQNYTTWYQPFDDLEKIQPAVNFALSQPVTGICTAGDTRILPLVLQACEDFTHLGPEDQEGLVEAGKSLEPLFV
jgi:aryl-alcohol dehydrogenase-like predicted oxidoreductase